VTRRTFLATSSALLASVAARAAAQPWTYPGIILPSRSRRPVGDFAPPLLDAEQLRALARAAIDAAIAAGAEMADIRVSDHRSFFTWGRSSQDNRLTLGSNYGLRVRVGGAETFLSGAELARDHLIATAQRAAATVKGLATVAKTPPRIAPAPVVTGEWEVPVELHPFDVSPDDHLYVVGGLGANHGQGVGAAGCDATVTWYDETRVVATSEGSLVTQRFVRCVPNVGFRSPGFFTDWIGYRTPLFKPCSVGFEYLLRPGIHDALHEAGLELAELTKIKNAPLTDVGRKEIVFDGYVHAQLIGEVLAPALTLARVIGEDQDHSGTSVFGPTSQWLGQPIGSPLVNLQTQAALPGIGAAKWDDEAVATQPQTLISAGRLTDYFCTRANREAVAGLPTTLAGTTTAADVQCAPVALPTEVTMPAAETGPSYDELVRSIQDGYVLRQAWWVGNDQQCAGGTIAPDTLLEVRRGKIVRRIMGAQIAVTTRKFWQGLTALGGTDTLRTEVTNDMTGPPWKNSLRFATAPAAHFKEADIVRPTR